MYGGLDKTRLWIIKVAEGRAMKGERFKENRSAMSESIAQAQAKGSAEFQAWFNKTTSEDESIIRGHWDFSYYFASREVCRYMQKPEEKSCLEIGYGGGRLLNASRNFFRYSYGVDVHPFAKEVGDVLLERRPIKDFDLFRLEVSMFPLESETIDYAYSFIVIQHFFSIDILIAYIDELSRVVRSGGLVNLYFADLRKFDGNKGLTYMQALKKGYLEMEYPPDATTAYNTLWITRRWMKRHLEKSGFVFCAWDSSYKQMPDGYPGRLGTQSGILAQKV